MQLVKITNPSTPADPNYRNLHFVHQDEVFDIAPGAEVIVPIEIATAHFGHPKARDNGRDRDRSDTFNQMRFQWGYQLGDIGAAEHWERIKPPFKVTTLDGEYLPMVLDDPDGKIPLPGEDPGVLADPGAAETAILRQAVAAQQAQIDKLLEAIAQREVNNNPGIVPPAPDAPRLNPDAEADPTNLPKPSAHEDTPKADAPRTQGTKATSARGSGTTLGGN